MPRLAISEQEKRSRKIISAIHYYREMNGVGKTDFHKRCGFTNTTFNKRERSPEEMTLEELYRIANVLNVGVKITIGEFTA